MIKIICVGKIKERFLQDGIQEYLKRISSYTKIEIVEVKEERIANKERSSDIEIVKQAEGEKILKQITNEYVISLEVEGTMLKSQELANKITEIFTYHNPNISFIIGGSYGLSNEVISRADFQMSFSRMTFTHMLMRLILLEQIYRAFKIIKNEPYDK